MLRALVTAPVMMCTSASSRTPLMPTGSLMPSWSSTMNSCGMTWMISRSCGMAICFAASMTRSTSAAAISLSLRETATTPRLFRLRMWSPAMPACTPLASRPAMRSASSTARVMLATVFSRSTTAPRRRPSLGALPTPTIRSSPVGPWSAMMQEIFVVPISRPANVRLPCAMGFPPAVASNVLRAAGCGGGAVGLRAAHDDLVLEPHVHLTGRHALGGEVGGRGPQAGQLSSPVRPHRRQHADPVQQHEPREAGVGDVHLRDLPGEPEGIVAQNGRPRESSSHVHGGHLAARVHLGEIRAREQRHICDHPLLQGLEEHAGRVDLPRLAVLHEQRGHALVHAYLHVAQARMAHARLTHARLHEHELARAVQVQRQEVLPRGEPRAAPHLLR